MQMHNMAQYGVPLQQGIVMQHQNVRYAPHTQFTSHWGLDKILNTRIDIIVITYIIVFTAVNNMI